MSRSGSNGRPRIVVTGLGAATPVGVGVQQTWSALVEGISGIGRLTRFDPADYRSR